MGSRVDQVRALVRRYAGRRARSLPAGVRENLRVLRQWLLEHDHGLGAVEARRCRATGAMRVLYRPGTQGDAEEQWLVICESHGSVLSVATRGLGASAMSDPDWCDMCEKRGPQ